MDQLLLTPSALLSILTQIDELKDKNVEVSENLDGTLQLQIGESVYNLQESDSVEVRVDDNAIEEVDNLNTDTYLELEETQGVEFSEDSVEGGILSELIKTLAVGGMVRLTTKLLTPKEGELFDKYARENMTRSELREARKNNVYQFRKRG